MGRFFPSTSAASDSSDILEKNAILQGNTCKYKVRRLLGQGTFGSVVHCINLDSKVNVAVKVAKKEFVWLAKRESAVSKKLRILDLDKNNLLKFYEVFTYMDHTCIVMEKLDISLKHLICKSKETPMPVASIRVILQQMLVALKALKSIGLIHTDIKPDNIMFVNRSQDPLRVKLIDFGCAGLPSKMNCGSICQALRFRAPEVMLGLPVNEAADMWSLACVAALLFKGNYLYPISCEYEMMSLIVQLNGQPDDHMLDDGMHTRKFFYKMNVWRLNTAVQYETITGIKVTESNITSFMYTCWDDLTQDHPQPKTASEREDIREFLSLLKRMLCVDPAKRITPTEGLEHRFITMRHLTDMPSSNRNVKCFPFRRKPCPPVVADVEIPNFVTSSEVLHFGTFSSSCENPNNTYIIYKPTADPHNKSSDQPKDSTPADGTKDSTTAAQPTGSKPEGKPKTSQPLGKTQKSKPGCNTNQSKNGYNTEAVCGTNQSEPCRSENKSESRNLRANILESDRNHRQPEHESNKSNSHRNGETTHCTVKTKKTALKRIRTFFSRMKRSVCCCCRPDVEQ